MFNLYDIAFQGDFIMELREYLFKNRIKQREFAEKVGCSKEYISNLCNGKNPGKILRQCIINATGGLVEFPLEKTNNKPDESQQETHQKGQNDSAESGILN